MRIERFFYFNFFRCPAKVMVYWVADQTDAANDSHNVATLMYDNMNNMRISVGLMAAGLISVPNVGISKNAQIDIICSVVLIFPMEKRALGTGISIFWVPRNSRRPEMYNSRAIMMMIGTTMYHMGNIIANIIIVFTTNNLSPI